MKKVTISVFLLAFVSMGYGSQSLTVNDQAVDSIILKEGQSCSVKVLSDDSTSYDAYVGFDDRLNLGSFSHIQTMPEAGSFSDVTEVDESFFRGYYVRAAGISPPSAGVHFIFQYQAAGVEVIDLKLYAQDGATMIDSVRITVVAAEVGTSFTYQGHLYDNNNVADGSYDFEFGLYDSPSDGNQLAGTVIESELDVIDGYFTVELDFGSVFDGNGMWLGIGVRPGDQNDPNIYTSLRPRQKIMPTPYSNYSSTAGSTNWSGVIDVPSDLLDGDDVGITRETDPTVLVSVKDGVSWDELIGIPAGFADGVDDTGGDGTYYWSCVGANFHPRYNDTSNTDIDRDSASIEAEDTGIFFFAPVMLPDGAKVTKIVVYGNATAEAWKFRSVQLNTTSMNDIAGTNIGTEVTLGTPHTINNGSFAYVLWTASLDSGDVIYNARITYTK